MYPRDLTLALERVADTSRKYADTEVHALRAALSIALSYVPQTLEISRVAQGADWSPVERISWGFMDAPDQSLVGRTVALPEADSVDLSTFALGSLMHDEAEMLHLAAITGATFDPGPHSNVVLTADGWILKEES